MTPISPLLLLCSITNLSVVLCCSWNMLRKSDHWPLGCPTAGISSNIYKCFPDYCLHIISQICLKKHLEIKALKHQHSTLAYSIGLYIGHSKITLRSKLKNSCSIIKTFLKNEEFILSSYYFNKHNNKHCSFQNPRRSQTIIPTQTKVWSAKCVHLTIYFPYPTVDHVSGYTQ